MARCVVSQIVDTNRGDAFAVACMVHTAYAPCPHDGKPANPTPLHAWSDQPRAALVQMWEQRTRRQRPLLIHNGSPADTPKHQVDVGLTCWCHPELVAAVA